MSNTNISKYHMKIRSKHVLKYIIFLGLKNQTAQISLGIKTVP